MADPKKIVVNKVKDCPTAPLDTFQDFQGELKSIKPKNLYKLMESIKRNGFTAPLFVWKDKILDGHQRKKALDALKVDGYEIPAVPYVVIEADTQTQAKEILLTYISQYGDVEKSGLETFISEAGLAAESIMSFTVLPLDQIAADQVKPDQYEVNLNLAPRTKVGEIWQLGNHRLAVGDSTDPKLWERLMEGEKAQMCFTDPPYNVDYHSLGKNLKDQGKASIKNDKMDDDVFEQFLHDFLMPMRDHMQPDGVTYVCYSSNKHIQFENALRNSGYVVRNQIIWVKPVASMGWGDYRWRHEPILYCGLGNKKKTFFKGDRTHTTVMGDKDKTIEMQDNGSVVVQLGADTFVVETVGGGGKLMVKKLIGSKSTVWAVGREGNYDHPTQKPVALVKRAILNSSNKEDIVLDPFGGSGATLITCEMTQRRCATIELDPKFADVIIDRWEKKTEKKAKRL